MNRRTLIAGAAAALVPTASSGQGAARQRLLMMTGAAGGAFFEYGPAFAKLVAESVPIDLDVQPSGGSNENIRAVARGDADLGLINMGPAFEAWQGRHPFTADGPLRNLRALIPMYNTPFSLIALRAKGLTEVSQLGGATVGVGPAGGPGQVFFEGLSKALGIRPKIATGSPTDLAERVIAGEIDAFWYGAGVPLAAFVTVLERADAVVFGLLDREIAALQSVFAYFAPAEIPAGSYKGQTAPLKTAAVWNFVVASDRMGEDAAYAITQAVLDRSDALRAAYPTADGTVAANVLNDTFLPLHPGAVRYYREKGIALPAALLPS